MIKNSPCRHGPVKKNARREFYQTFSLRWVLCLQGESLKRTPTALSVNGRDEPSDRSQKAHPLGNYLANEAASAVMLSIRAPSSSLTENTARRAPASASHA